MAGEGDDRGRLEARLIGLADNQLRVWSSPSEATSLLREAAAVLAECRRALEAAEEDLDEVMGQLSTRSLGMVRAALARLREGS